MKPLPALATRPSDARPPLRVPRRLDLVGRASSRVPVAWQGVFGLSLAIHAALGAAWLGAGHEARLDPPGRAPRGIVLAVSVDPVPLPPPAPSSEPLQAPELPSPPEAAPPGVWQAASQASPLQPLAWGHERLRNVHLPAGLPRRPRASAEPSRSEGPVRSAAAEAAPPGESEATRATPAGSEAASEALPAVEGPRPPSTEPAPSRPAMARGAQPPPEYPRLARRRGWEGSVDLLARVAADGTVVALSIVGSSGHRVLDDAALQAVGSWEFEPAREAGLPVAGDAAVTIEFVLEGASKG